MANLSKSILLKKYNIPGPRYTSYPTVPYWEPDNFTGATWAREVQQTFSAQEARDGVSLYIHLPYCERLCTYCGCNTRITINHAVEVPYIKAVLQEWEIYKRILGKTPHIRELHLGGGTPTFFSPENLFMLVDGLLSGSIIADEAEFSFEGHPSNTTFEHLKTLYGLGFRRVSFGIQDFDPKVQEIINRPQPVEEVVQVVEWARSIGYASINFDLVYGLPLQTLDTMVETVGKVVELRPDRIAFYSYAHIPWLKPGQRKFTEADLPSDNTKRALYETGRTMLEAAGYFEIGMDHFSLPSDSLYSANMMKTLHRNFMGYTTSSSSLLIGLGASSISDTWTAFAQNVKTVEEYIREVNNGNLPVFKGHILTEEDKMLRRHILNVVCKGHTKWSVQEMNDWGLDEILVRLSELEKDGLIILSDSELQVTPAGRPFLRNVCMAFDRRLHQKEPDKPVFSKVI
jgi:oxygen-independent coproporphyrinogen-3 oxidase